MCKSNFKAIKEGYNIIILSDRGVSDKMSNTNVVGFLCPSFDEYSKVRSKFGIIIESAEPREPHHFAFII
jgi:glutamate synthase (ferredoxin)